MFIVGVAILFSERNRLVNNHRCSQNYPINYDFDLIDNHRNKEVKKVKNRSRKIFNFEFPLDSPYGLDSNGEIIAIIKSYFILESSQYRIGKKVKH